MKGKEGRKEGGKEKGGGDISKIKFRGSGP